MSFKVVHTWELPPDPSQPPPEQVKSGLFHNGKYAWWTRGSYLEVRQLAPLITLSSRDFGGVPRDAEVRITCVAELPRDQTSLPLLVVALHCPVTAGLICVFDCFASTVVRAVRLEHYLIHKQFNSPINLYSEPNVVDTIQKQTGVHAQITSAPKRSVKFNPAESETYKYLKEEEEMGQYQSAPVQEITVPPQSKIYTPTKKPANLTNQHPAYLTAIGNNPEVIQQSGSFRRLMYSVLPGSNF